MEDAEHPSQRGEGAGTPITVSMQIFSALGIVLCGKAVPAHFGDLGKAPYSLFTCITLAGWLDIYEAFQ